MLPLPIAELARFALGVALSAALIGPSEGDSGRVRVTLDVKDADAPQLAVALVRGAGRQAVLASAAPCRLTLALRDVAWDVALQHVLRPCGMVAEWDGDVALIATLDELTERARQRRALNQARQKRRGRPEVTTVRLSYARAGEMAETIRRSLPPGAEIAVDERSNTLVIKH